jgi:hypothetical protein
MTKLEEFYNKLETLRKPKSDDPYDNRITHCYLLYVHEGKTHKFDVRGWSEIKDDILRIGVVNWTLCAGSASLELTEEYVDDWTIEEEE